jgi:hypothetical protein
VRISPVTQVDSLSVTMLAVVPRYTTAKQDTSFDAWKDQSNLDAELGVGRGVVMDTMSVGLESRREATITH